LNIPFILEKAIHLYENTEAVICRGERFTYGEFGRRVFKLSRLLKGLGVGYGDRISILHRNGHPYLEFYFAAAQIGAVLNPLNYRLSAGEVDFILKDAGSNILIAETCFGETVDRLNGFTHRIRHVIWTGEGDVSTAFEVLRYEEEIQRISADVVSPPDIDDNDVAHLYYTSGTTGRPKGVMLSHKNVSTHALAAIAELNLSDRDVWIHVAPLFHLADAWATFAVTWVGGKHVVVPEFDPVQVLQTIEKERVTLTNMVPTMLNALVNAPDVNTYTFEHLRVILSGGAPIAPEIIKKIMDTFKCDYIQTYGMTETSPYLTLSKLKEDLLNLPPEDQFDFKAKTGRPFLGVRLKVIRDDGTEVRPDGDEVGEIVVNGDIVTQGYWNRPEETAKVIRDGWLYTGDLAMIDREGYVNIVDRKKDMIITGGENVYSVEVENVLYAHPAVLEAAVIGVADRKWGEAVKAFVVLQPEQTVSEDDIIDYCKKRIARYKAPKSVEFLDELPKTGSGKIFKKGLRGLGNKKT